MKSEDHNKDRQFEEVLADYLRKVGAGETVDRQVFLNEHPELRDKLAAYFQSDKDTSDTDERNQTVGYEHTPTRAESPGLQIRCPHCSNGVELLPDAPIEDITCVTCGSTFNLSIEEEDDTTAAPAVRHVGRFELLTRLGIGAFGTVWKARDTELDRFVAIKIPRKAQLAGIEAEQFFREARSAAQLRHPNIVPVHELGRDGTIIFIVSDLVEGVSLTDWMTAHRPAGREVARICATVCSALHHAHEHGVIHRDLKPSNIMIDREEELFLMDFGLAKRETNEVTMTMEGQVLGTPAYMSPEQARGHSHWTDCRTDIYSVGVIMFELLTGERPYRGNAQMQVHQKQVDDAPDPRTLNRHIPRDLATICLKCLERDPNRRYYSAEKLERELQRYLSGEPILARPISRAARLGRWCKRNPAITAIAGLLTLLAIGGPTLAWKIERQRQRLEEVVAEKNTLIERVSADKQTSVEAVTELKKELAIWTGEANPWEIWPPEDSEGPRLKLLQHAYSNQVSAFEKQLENNDMSPQAQATALLGLAVLADSTGHRDVASDHYQQASQLIKKLVKDNPENMEFKYALADCHNRLSQLLVKKDKTAAESHLASAISLLKELSESTSKYQAKIDWLDAEMRQAVLAGFKDAKQQLTTASELNASLEGSWPTEPDEFYELVNLLANRPAYLTPKIVSVDGE